VLPASAHSFHLLSFIIIHVRLCVESRVGIVSIGGFATRHGGGGGIECGCCGVSEVKDVKGIDSSCRGWLWIPRGLEEEDVDLKVGAGMGSSVVVQ
jgi:hypothetical protein